MNLPRRLAAGLALSIALCIAPSAMHGYSVLTHEEVVDLVWTTQTVPLLKARYPGITPEQLHEAHAFAYGGSVIQDLGYYPFGSTLFSDLLHYVRTGDFVVALLRDANTPDELAFALGALAHYTSDEIGHPYVNQVTPQEFPKLHKKYGGIVTYAQAPTSHLRTEFGFDVVGVARGKYSQDSYRDFIGFQVAKPLLERAFLETYGIRMDAIVKNEDLAISTYRWTISSLIPRMTKIALLSYPDEIEHANPGYDRTKFRYRMERTEFEKHWGGGYKKPGLGSHILAAIISVLPKVGPLKALKLQLPNGNQQTIYIHSVNLTVDTYQQRLILLTSQAVPAPLPTIATSNGHDPDAGTQNIKSAEANAGALDHNPTANRTATAPSRDPSAPPNATQAPPNSDSAALNTAPTPRASTPQPQTTNWANLTLYPVNLDTGKATAPGEYSLADQTYADLLEKVVKLDSKQVPPEIRAALLDYYDTKHDSQNLLSHKPKQWKKVQANLVRLKATPAPNTSAQTQALH